MTENICDPHIYNPECKYIYMYMHQVSWGFSDKLHLTLASLETCKK